MSLNVIVIISDSFRRDCLSCYGAPPWAARFPTGSKRSGGSIHTPHLDRFAERALIFDNAYIASFPTVPARNDIFTGRYTWTYKPWSPLGADETTLSEALNEGGVLTGIVADTPHPYAPGYNYQRGFQTWELIRGQENDRWRAAPDEVKMPAAPYKLRNPERTMVQYLRNVHDRQWEEEYFPARTFREAARWLERNHRRQPFFLHVDTFDPHEPWDPPQYFIDLYDPDYEGEEVIYPRYGYCDYLSEAELDHCRALYAGEATLVDRWFGYFLDRIESLGLLENTVVFFLSDHGFYLGEHGSIGKVIITDEFQQSIPLYPEVARIPLLAHLPPGMARPGERVSNLVQTVDLMPTICELFGIPAPSSAPSHSFAPVLRGEEAGSRAKSFVICSPTLSHPDIEVPHPTTRASIYHDNWLLVYGSQVDAVTDEETTTMVDSVLRSVKTIEQGPIRPKLYDLDQDPCATQDLLADNQAVAAALHADFVTFLEEQQVPEKHLRFFRNLNG